MKKYLDYLKNKYETVDFIKSDPVKFPHIFKNDRKNLELIAFISSIFAYGRREAFINKIDLMLNLMDFDPYKFILNFSSYENRFDGFLYRFYAPDDIKALFNILSQILKTKGSIGELFYENKSKNVKEILASVYEYFSNSKYYIKTNGFSFMISNPNNKGANKRMNMFLRWMVRDGVVDFGIWDFIDKKDLIIPLDVHSANVARNLGLLKRKQNDYMAAIELNEKLKEFNYEDPAGYDFALFGAGVNKDNLQVLK